MYADLSPEDKVLTAIEFVARGTELPLPLAQFLRDEGLYELITQPQEDADDYVRQ
jgi:hypothetical protein